MFKNFCTAVLHMLSDYDFARKRLGGHWERWYTDHPICSDIWYQVSKCSHDRGVRPHSLCRGTPQCADYGEPS